MPQWIAIAILAAALAFSLVAGYVVTFKTPLYYKIPKKSRPHRWIVLSLLIVLFSFLLFFPLFLFSDNDLLRKIGLWMGMGPFIGWGVFFRVLGFFGIPGLLDEYIYRRWPEWTTER